MGSVLTFVVGLSLVGMIPAFWVTYFRSGLSDIKATYGIDWREFYLSNLGYWISHFVLWPIGLIAWLRAGRPPKKVAVISIDGREVRSFVSSQHYTIDVGRATSSATV